MCSVLNTKPCSVQVKPWELYILVFSPDILLSHWEIKNHSPKRSFSSGECPLYHFILQSLGQGLSLPAASVYHLLPHWLPHAPWKHLVSRISFLLRSVGARGNVIPSEIPSGSMNGCINVAVT